MGYPGGAVAGRNGRNFTTLAQYFATRKAHRGGNWECRVREAGSSDPLVLRPPQHCQSLRLNTDFTLFRGKLIKYNYYIFKGVCYWREFSVSKWVGLDNSLTVHRLTFGRAREMRKAHRGGNDEQ